MIQHVCCIIYPATLVAQVQYVNQWLWQSLANDVQISLYLNIAMSAFGYHIEPEALGSVNVLLKAPMEVESMQLKQIQ